MVNRGHFPLIILCVALWSLLSVIRSAHGGPLASPMVVQEIRVGVFNNYPVIYEKGGKPTGFQLELLKHVAAQEGWILSYSFHSSLKNVLESLDSGSIDLALGIEPTDERMAHYDFTSVKHAVLTGQIFVKEGRADIQRMQDLDGKTVALLSESVAGEFLIDTCSRLKTKTSLRRVNSYQEMAEAVATGAVDAGLFNEYHRRSLSSLYKIQPTPIIFKPTEVQFAVLKNSNSSLVNELDRYLEREKVSPNSKYRQLEKKFLPVLTQGPQPWDKQSIIVSISACLLLVVFAIMIGAVLPNLSKEPSIANLAKEDIRQVVKFVMTITAVFWLLDTCVAWVLFNDSKKLTFIEWLLTNIPRENLYIRCLLFVVACIFGLYLLKYVHKYQRVLDVLVISLSRFEQLTDNARDMIFRMSLPAGEYEFVSKASLDIFGYSPAEFYKKPLFVSEMVHSDWKSYFAKQWEEVLSGNVPPYFEFQVVDKSGRTRWVNQRNTLYLTDSGVPYALEGIVTDVTIQRQAEATVPPNKFSGSGKGFS